MDELWRVVKLGEPSPLKVELNRGVMRLASANESHFRPHVCLNGIEGVRVLSEIGPDSNTEFNIRPHLIVDGDRIWLNVAFFLYLDRAVWPTNFAKLTPRQTAFIVQRLPYDARSTLLAMVTRWYREQFLADMEKGLRQITGQFENGQLLFESDHENRIFDIHGGRPADIPYTEPSIAGEALYSAVCLGGTLFELGQDEYGRADSVIVRRRERQADAVRQFRGLVRALDQG